MMLKDVTNIDISIIKLYNTYTKQAIILLTGSFVFLNLLNEIHYDKMVLLFKIAFSIPSIQFVFFMFKLMRYVKNRQ